MRVFVTGATGFVGSAVVEDLIAAGHHVLGLARSDASEAALLDAGATVHRGDLEDLDSLRRGADMADGVIHTGFIHDFARFKEVCQIDGLAIAALGDALVGTNKPLVVTAGLALVAPGRLAVETDTGPTVSDTYPRMSEQQAAAALARGVHVSVVRLAPSVHGDGDYGFIPMLIDVARQKGVSAYIGDGRNRWAAIPRQAAGSLFRLALEKGQPGANYHGCAEEGIVFNEIAEAIGRGLNIPAVSKTLAEARDHFGWFAAFAGIDCAASSSVTRATLGWCPSGSGLIEDLRQGRYFDV